jgi:hypothetical protein
LRSVEHKPVQFAWRGGAAEGSSAEAGPGQRDQQTRRCPRSVSAKAHGFAALLVAGLVGRVSDSPGFFLVALVALLVASYHTGDSRR